MRAEQETEKTQLRVQSAEGGMFPEERTSQMSLSGRPHLES